MSVFLNRSHIGSLSHFAASSADADDVLFINERFDNGLLKGAKFVNCTFANISFKDAKLEDCHFSNCVFQGCYFRRTKFKQCHFPASRFIESEFDKPSIFACGFQTTKFSRAVPKFEYMEASLPGEANLCRDLCSNLAVEASQLGLDQEARRYRLETIRMREKALSNGFRWADAYSKDHFPDVQRVVAFFKLCGSRINGWVWGHGERLRRLVTSAIVFAFGVGPILFYVSRNDLNLENGNSLRAIDYFSLSVASVLNSSDQAGVVATGTARIVVYALTAGGLVFFGLFVTYIFRAVTRR